MINCCKKTWYSLHLMFWLCFLFLCHSRNLGGKLGTAITDILGVEYIGELTRYSETELQTHFGDKTG